LLADQSATLNVTVELGQTNEVVRVEGSAALVDTVTGTQKQVINETQMVELPLNGRNAAELSYLVAGASPSPNGVARDAARTANTFRLPTRIRRYGTGR
jgi:hypothetical protein